MVGNAHRPPCQNTVVFHIFNCILYDVIEYKAVAPALHIWFADSYADSAMLSFPSGKDFLCGISGKCCCLFHNGIA